jgi:hypothetical protein
MIKIVLCMFSELKEHPNTTYEMHVVTVASLAMPAHHNLLAC